MTKSKFIKVECRNCGNTQVLFNRATSEVSCLVCNKPLAEPTGGISRILGEVKRSF